MHGEDHHQLIEPAREYRAVDSTLAAAVIGDPTAQSIARRQSSHDDGDHGDASSKYASSVSSRVFERIFKLLASDHDNEYMMIDATIVRAHQHSAGARKKTARKPSADPAAD